MTDAGTYDFVKSAESQAPVRSIDHLSVTALRAPLVHDFLAALAQNSLAPARLQQEMSTVECPSPEQPATRPCAKVTIKSIASVTVTVTKESLKEYEEEQRRNAELANGWAKQHSAAAADLRAGASRASKTAETLEEQATRMWGENWMDKVQRAGRPGATSTDDRAAAKYLEVFAMQNLANDRGKKAQEEEAAAESAAQIRAACLDPFASSWAVQGYQGDSSGPGLFSETSTLFKSFAPGEPVDAAFQSQSMPFYETSTVLEALAALGPGKLETKVAPNGKRKDRDGWSIRGGVTVRLVAQCPPECTCSRLQWYDAIVSVTPGLPTKPGKYDLVLELTNEADVFCQPLQ